MPLFHVDPKPLFGPCVPVAFQACEFLASQAESWWRFLYELVDCPAISGSSLGFNLEAFFKAFLTDASSLTFVIDKSLFERLRWGIWFHLFATAFATLRYPYHPC